MVTGIETAGLVLAAFPIAVHALQNWIDGLRTLQKFRRIYRELENYSQILDTENVTFLNTLETLLTDLVHYEDLPLMLAQPTGICWKNPVYEDKLRHRLDRSYDSFMSTIEKMSQALQKFKEKLGISDDGAVSSLVDS